MKTFLVEHNDFRKPPIRVTLHNPPYENENILHKTGWKEKDVKITEVTINEISPTEEMRDSSIDKDYIGEE